ncbi:MAG: mechanosensitive ion channel, partial [Nitrospirota bacterium]|nr:mechanosensitive ion channel [Nitrospirota bacterium]
RHNPHEIKRIAEAAALNAHERICQAPEPICHLVEFGESSINFKLRFWIKDAEKGVTNIRGAVMLALWDAFQEHNIKIPYPQREISVTERQA